MGETPRPGAGGLQWGLALASEEIRGTSAEESHNGYSSIGPNTSSALLTEQKCMGYDVNIYYRSIF